MPIAADRHNVGQLRLGPWRINLRSGTVVADSEQGKLLPRAESLLLLLCRHANEVVGREQILDNVWAGRVVEDAAISHCIWQIRKALGDQGKDVLQTLSKRGYLLTVPDDAWLVVSDAVMPSSSDALQAQSDCDDPPTAQAGSDSPLPHTPLARPRVRKSAAAGIALGIALILGLWAWWAQRATPARVMLQPQGEMTVAVLAPETLQWLREPALRAVVESVHLRDGDVIAFQRAQRKNPFAGPHLQIEIAPGSGRDVVATLRLHHGAGVVREEFNGPGSALAGAVRALLDRSLAPAGKTPMRADDALISALTADLLFDHTRALVEYRRALARDPGSVAAMVTTAIALHEQGRGREALALIDGIPASASPSASQRCEIQVLIVQLAPERAKPPLCARARRLSGFKRLEMREVLRDIAADQGRRKGGKEWSFDEMTAVRAHIRLGEIAEAEDRIAQAQRTAADAGWSVAGLNFQAQRAAVAMSQGREQQGVKIGLDAADAMEALGEVRRAIDFRNFSLRFAQVAPGPATTERRRILQKLADRARAVGSVRGEMATLHMLATLERDRPDVSRSHLQRIRELIDTAYTPAMAVQDKQIVLNEIRYGLRYRETLDGVAALDRAGATHAQAQLWNLTLRVVA